MAIAHMVLVILALVCLGAAATGEIKSQHVNLTAAGLFLWALSTLVTAGK